MRVFDPSAVRQISVRPGIHSDNDHGGCVHRPQIGFLAQQVEVEFAVGMVSGQRVMDRGFYASGVIWPGDTRPSV